MKDYNENKESPYLKYWNVNNLYEWAISQKLPLCSFKWIKNISQFNKDFVKRFNEKNEEGYFFKLMLNILKHCMNGLPFFTKRMEIGQVEKPISNVHYKKNMLIMYKI